MNDADRSEQRDAVADSTARDDAPGGLLARLAKTRRNLGRALGGLFGGGALDADTLDALHDQLLLADVGVEASARIINRLRDRANVRSADEWIGALRAEIGEILAPCARPLEVDRAQMPFVILMVGVNGVGKTTTLAKLAARLQRDGATVMLAACDTFRAAAVEQLQAWGRRLDVPVIAQAQHADGKRADAAAVAHDALQAARARGADVLLIDTAGRQHTDDDLMQQLKKVARVLRKIDSDAPHETLLCLDAGTGQNALAQAEQFHRAVGVTGLCVTKLDGTAKGGVVVALAERLKLPIRYLGVGERAEDLRPFGADEFAAALLPDAASATDDMRDD